MEKRWPPERVKSFEAPRLLIAWATSLPPWTAVFCSTWCFVAIVARLARGQVRLDVVEGPAGRVGVELGGVGSLLRLLDRLPGAPQLSPPPPLPLFPRGGA